MGGINFIDELVPIYARSDQHLEISQKVSSRLKINKFRYKRESSGNKAPSGYGRPVSRTDFKFWPQFGRGTDAGRDPKGH